MTDMLLDKISKKLFEYFVTNPSVIAMQMPDGKYIPQAINYDYNLFCQMLEKGSSLAVYQQKAYSSLIKWICLDFDIIKGKETEATVEELYEVCIVPLCEFLDQNRIKYLLEYSGRRGIHVWIIFEELFEKQIGFDFINFILKNIKFGEKFDKVYTLDKFPATRFGKNKFGKAVKLPLSVHKKSKKQSFFLDGKEDLNTKRYLISAEGFYLKQYSILENYTINPMNIFDDLGINKVTDTKLKYRKQQFQKLSIDFDELVESTNNSVVFIKLWDRVKKGELNYYDRLFLVGTFSHVDTELLNYIFSIQPNYNERTTQNNIMKLKQTLYPITISYLYDVYGETIESHMIPSETVLEYIFRVTKSHAKLINSKENIKNITSVILEKEQKYLLYNDEVVDPRIYYDLKNMLNIDIQKIEDKALNIINKGDKTTKIDLSPYYLFVRKELKGNEGRERILVSLSATDRVLTTRLIYEFVHLVNWKFNSYSYNINFWEDDNLFFPFWSSWQNFINDIELYLRFEIFDDYGIIKLDLSRFYDSIYLHSIYSNLKEMLIKKSKENRNKLLNILSFLSRFNDKVMKEINGSIKGVPQGPAYARVIAEFYLSTVIEEFSNNYKKNNPNSIFKFYRYVDDMFILYKNIDDDFLEEIQIAFEKVGLVINFEKTRNYERIGELSTKEKEKFFEDIYFNYQVKSFDSVETLSDLEQNEIITFFDQYIKRKGKWDINDANFLLGDFLDENLQLYYIDKYYSDILTSSYGRGSIFSKFYRTIFKTPKLVFLFFSNRDYQKIPVNSINEQCFISILFFELNNLKDIVRKSELIECVNTLIENLDDLSEYSVDKIEVIKKRLENNEG